MQYHLIKISNHIVIAEKTTACITINTHLLCLMVPLGIIWLQPIIYNCNKNSKGSLALDILAFQLVITLKKDILVIHTNWHPILPNEKTFCPHWKKNGVRWQYSGMPWRDEKCRQRSDTQLLVSPKCIRHTNNIITQGINKEREEKNKHKNHCETYHTTRKSSNSKWFSMYSTEQYVESTFCFNNIDQQWTKSFLACIKK